MQSKFEENGDTLQSVYIFSFTQFLILTRMEKSYSIFAVT